MRTADLSGVVDLLYDGMLDDSAWVRALERLHDSFHGNGLALFSTNPATGRVYRADMLRNDNSLIGAYSQFWIHQDPRHVEGLCSPIGEAQTEASLVRWRDLVRSAVYNEFLVPNDIPYFTAVWVDRRPQRGVVLSIQRSRAAGAFDDGYRRRLEHIVPHLRRVLEVKDRLSQARCQTSGLLETMDRLPFGVLLLADDLSIVEASSMARAAMAARNCIHADSGRLGFVQRANEKDFVARLKVPHDGQSANDVLVLRGAGGIQSLSLLVAPLAAGSVPWLSSPARWLVLVFAMAQPASVSTLAIQSVLRVTPAEAALAQQLVAGKSLAIAAAALGVTRSTARTQLRSIFSKTGLGSQAQLVSRILSGPAILSERDWT